MTNMVTNAPSKEVDKSENGVPSWFCPYKIPKEFLGGVQPLVCLVGLYPDKYPSHRLITELIVKKQSAKDFQPMYTEVPLDYKFPVKKQKV